jgi:hypothetical protein
MHMPGTHRASLGCAFARLRKRAGRRILAFVCCALSLLGCDPGGTGPYVPLTSVTPTTQVSLECIDAVWWGGELKVVVNSQREYDALTYELFQRPLNEWREEAFPTILESVRRDYPGLPDSAQLRIAEERLYEYLPFLGTKGCKQPAIDFTTCTLLGYAISASGCDPPDYAVEVTTDRMRMTTTMTVGVVQHGWCDMAIYKIVWVVVPKIPFWYSVSFATTMSRVESAGQAARAPH